MYHYDRPLTNIPLSHQGKTRDTYHLGIRIFEGEAMECMLVVATDRISTHNIVHASTITHKGWVLNAMTVYWLAHAMRDQPWKHHMLVYGAAIYDHLPGQRDDYPRDLHWRAIIVRKLDMISVEFIHRAYLAGSLYKETTSGRDPYELGLTGPLPLMTPFVPPAFTPTRKSEKDEPMSQHEVMRRHPAAYTLTRRVFDFTRKNLLLRGIDLVDSKFEVGADDSGVLYLADEVATTDSSRFIRAGDARIGEEPKWLDKQLARDEAERIWKDGPRRPLSFGPHTVRDLSNRFKETFNEVVGMRLEQFQQDHLN